jgi:hypothetical protein
MVDKKEACIILRPAGLGHSRNSFLPWGIK